MTQTLFAIHPNGTLREYPFGTSDHRLKDVLWGDGILTGDKCTVYAYVLNRAKEFRDPFYGWRKPRDGWTAELDLRRMECNRPNTPRKSHVTRKN